MDWVKEVINYVKENPRSCVIIGSVVVAYTLAIVAAICVYRREGASKKEKHGRDNDDDGLVKRLDSEK